MLDALMLAVLLGGFGSLFWLGAAELPASPPCCYGSRIAIVRLTLSLNSGVRTGFGTAKLLESVQACGSISEAARVVGMDYKRAWWWRGGLKQRSCNWRRAISKRLRRTRFPPRPQGLNISSHAGYQFSRLLHRDRLAAA